MERDGRQGVFLWTGYWMDLETRQFVELAAAPLRSCAEYPNSLFTFRGRPTEFGNPECDDSCDCPRTNVIQYDPIRDTWDNIGKLTQV